MKLLLIAASLLSSSALAIPMEVITVIYRSPQDYALYQQNAEMMGYFNAELNITIMENAHHQLQQMRQNFRQTALISRQSPEDECTPTPHQNLLALASAPEPETTTQ